MKDSNPVPKADARAMLKHWLRVSRPYLPLLATAVVLTLIYLVTVKIPASYQQTQWISEFSRLFDLNDENNVPTWFSSFLWSTAAYCCYRLRKVDQGASGRFRNSGYWLWLGVVCLLLSLDEVAQVHESVGSVAGHMGMHLPIYSWLPFGMAFVAVVAVGFSRFLWSLPRDIALAMIVAGAIFVTGAVGFETLGALVDDHVLSTFPMGLSWHKEIAIEEFLEMLGVIVFIAALDVHMRRIRWQSPG